ncbi:MAG: hypothetical protein H0X30_14895 [Anaerolineae bacterium]|nr:hypothetical protein [Anaerolineae bacterium]
MTNRFDAVVAVETPRFCGGGGGSGGSGMPQAIRFSGKIARFADGLRENWQD